MKVILIIWPLRSLSLFAEWRPWDCSVILCCLDLRLCSQLSHLFPWVQAQWLFSAFRFPCLYLSSSSIPLFLGVSVSFCPVSEPHFSLYFCLSASQVLYLYVLLSLFLFPQVTSFLLEFQGPNSLLMSVDSVPLKWIELLPFIPLLNLPLLCFQVIILYLVLSFFALGLFLLLFWLVPITVAPRALRQDQASIELGTVNTQSAYIVNAQDRWRVGERKYSYHPYFEAQRDKVTFPTQTGGPMAEVGIELR